MNKNFKITQDDIKEIPDINSYEEIVKAAKNGRLIIFIGAGISKLIGLPLWSEFALDRLNTVYEKELIDFRTYEKLKTIDPKKLLTICEIFMKENNIKPRPAKEIFKFNIDDEFNKIYTNLYSINAIYITTNYDECLDKLAIEIDEDKENYLKKEIKNFEENIKISNFIDQSEVIINSEEFLESKLRNGNVIHIHGSVKKENDMIITLDDYLNYYGTISKNKKTELSIFLDKVFNSKYVVLFMGYGLDEYEILEYMLSKSKNIKDIRNHYMLYSAFKEDYKMVDIFGKYYSKFGVELIPYDITQKGHKQLISIIEDWSNVLSKVSKNQDFIQNTIFIEDVLNSTEDEFEIRAKAVIDLVKKDESLEKYIFENIDDIRFLSIFIEEGFYNPEKVPRPINSDKGYIIHYWSNIDYINKIVKNINFEEDSNKVNVILNIIKDISIYKNNDGENIDNYHVFVGFINILSQIPNKFISIDIIELIKIWADSKFGSNLIIFEVAEKLLFKFLNSKEKGDIDKSEKIIDYIIKLDIINNKLKIDSYHFNNIFNKTTIELISKKCSMKLLDNIKKILSMYLYNSDSDTIIEFNNNKYLIKLYGLDKSIKVSIFKFEENDLLQTWLDKPLEKKPLYELETYSDNIYDFTDYVIKWIAVNFDIENQEKTIENKIRLSYESLYNKETYYSLYRNNKYYDNSGFELVLDLFKNLLVTKRDDLMENFLIELMKDKYLLFQKISLYIIGENISMYNEIFWKMIDGEEDSFIFQNSIFDDELRMVLEQLNDVDDYKQNKLLELIEKGPKNKFYFESEEKYIDIWKQKRLNSLKHIPKFKELYEEIRCKTGIDVKLGPMISDVEIKNSSNLSPLTEEKLLKMTNNEIAEFMKDFKTENHWNSPTVEGFGESINSFVENYPMNIVDDLEPFLNSSYYYVYKLIYGLKNAWKNKQFFEWEKVLRFIYDYINRNEFWNDEFKINDDYLDEDHKWVVSIICELIDIGSREKEWSFELKNYSNSKNILLFILERINSLPEENYNSSTINYVLNSIKGKALSALISMSLLSKSIQDRDNVWDEQFKIVYTNYIEYGVVDAYILLGWYLPQFMYLDRNWSTDIVNSINMKTELWESFMIGYINCREIYIDIYILMEKHYKYAIGHNFKEKYIKNKLAEHIAAVYISNSKKINKDEVYEEFINIWDYDMVNSFISYLTSKNNIYELEKILLFWELLYEKYKNYSKDDFSENDKKIISESLKFIGVLDEIDENSCKRLTFAIAYAEYDHNSYYILDELFEKINLDDSNEKRRVIGNIMTCLVENCMPIYHEEKIISIVKYIYDSKDEKLIEVANNICNIYAMKNINFLRDLYIQNMEDEGSLLEKNEDKE